MKILLACSAGMSTSIVERAMNKYAQENHLEATVEAKGVGVAKDVIEAYDVVLLGPQVSYELPAFQKLSKGTPVALMERLTYATADARKIFKQIEQILNSKK